jgi:hypothetical protein
VRSDDRASDLTGERTTSKPFGGPAPAVDAGIAGS